MHWSRAGAAALRPCERLTRRRSTVTSMLASSTRPPSMSSDSLFATRRWRLRRAWAGSGELHASATADTVLEAPGSPSSASRASASTRRCTDAALVPPVSAHLHERQQDTPVTVRRRGVGGTTVLSDVSYSSNRGDSSDLRFTHLSLQWL